MDIPVDTPALLYIEAGESDDSISLPAVASGRLTGFGLLPSEPAALTDEQLDVLFPPERRAVFCRELVRLALDCEP